MKNIFYSLLLVLFWSSCSEDHIGQTPVDGRSPLPVQNVEIESRPGGAKISYAIPKETDISYVKGEYWVNGRLCVVRSSVYKNYVLVEGLGTKDPLEIKLYTVDHSENQSEPIIKTITPGTPLVDLILESMKVATDFGGINVTWENILNSEIGITLLASNDKGVLEEGETLFTAVKNGDYSFRGYDDSKRTFALVLTDKWGNLSDTIKQEVTPYYERLLDKKKHKRLALPKDNISVYSSTYTFEKLFDNQLNTIWITAINVADMPLRFTIDLGVDATLSRFKLWHRGGYEFKNQTIKEFQVWGSNSYRENMDDEYWANGWKNDWKHMGDFITFKPSGMDGPVTNEDKEYATKGFEFKFPLNAEKYRYIRIVMTSNWSGGSQLEMGEISLYGNDK